MERIELRILREDIEEALLGVGTKHNVVLKIGRITYDSTFFVMKLEGSKINDDGEVLSRNVTAFKRLALHYNLKPTDLGKLFTYNNKRYKISGLKPKSSKYPILAIDVFSNKEYKFQASAVKQQLDLEV